MDAQEEARMWPHFLTEISSQMRIIIAIIYYYESMFCVPQKCRVEKPTDTQALCSCEELSIQLEAKEIIFSFQFVQYFQQFSKVSKAKMYYGPCINWLF